jgi:hypothetical protein
MEFGAEVEKAPQGLGRVPEGTFQVKTWVSNPWLVLCYALTSWLLALPAWSVTYGGTVYGLLASVLSFRLDH